METSSTVGTRGKWLVSSLTFGLACVFLVAFSSKVFAFESFETSLYYSLLIPNAWVRPAGVVLLISELVVALGLLYPPLRRVALMSMAVMISLFLAYALWRWVQNIPVPCHCFGALLTMTAPQALLLNLVLLTAVGWLLATIKPGSNDPLPA